MNKGIIKASRAVWESENFQDIRDLLKKEVNILREELDSAVFLEPPQGIYILHCESDHFDEKKNGPGHEYNVTFMERDGHLDIDIDE